MRGHDGYIDVTKGISTRTGCDRIRKARKIGLTGARFGRLANSVDCYVTSLVPVTGLEGQMS